MSRPDLEINTNNDYDDQDHHDDQRDDDEIYTDEESDSASIDSDIDFGLSYALHTFVATVEGQASVVKGDSLQLLDDSNSYWWLVNVLKTEDVGYIPAENIETPFERLARLNKFRNVDLAAATQEEKAVGANSRLQLRNVASPQDQPRALSPSPSFVEESATRRIGFGPPTFVDHPGDNPNWSDESDGGEYEEGEEGHDERHEGEGSDGDHERALEDDGMGEDSFGDEGEPNVLDGMEPDDGMSWDDEAGAEDQASHLASSGFARPDPSGLIDPSAYKEGPQTQQVQLVNQAPRKGLEHLDTHSFQHLAGSPSSSQQPNHSQVALGRILSPSQIVHSESQSSIPSTASFSNSPGSPIKSSSSRDFLDPALETGETRRIFATPAVARSSPPTSYLTGESLHPEMKRNVSHGSIASSNAESTDGERDSDVNSPNGEGKQKKKNSVFGSFFKKKDKKDKGIRASTILGGGSEAADGRDDASSLDDGSSHRASLQESPGPPTRTSTSSSRVSISSQSDPRKVSSPPLDQPSPTSASHSLRLQQIDQKQQALYQQYLAQTVHSPDSQSDPSLSYGTQAAAAVAQSSASQRLARASTGSTPKPRPGSLLITSNPSNAFSSDGGASSEPSVVSMLSVLRVFAGQAVESESTFKTVLLSETTTTNDLLQQALQRFRVGKEEAGDDYYLTVKGVDGDEEVLGPERLPLVVFNALNQEDSDIPTIRRSSIDSVSSEFSLNPAIARLGDWSDDSIVKLYLNKRPDLSSSTTSSLSAASENNHNHLTADSNSPQLGGPASTNRFTLQIVIYPEDLPDGMTFDTTTEAIVPRSALKNRSAHSSPVLGPDGSVSLSERRKFFLFPANTTVAEAVEVCLDRFGISDGVVDGGDEVEEKLSQRRSVARVRYGLSVRNQSGEERALQPSTKLLDTYSTPPTLRSQPITDARERRRSREVPLAKPNDILPSDPSFIIRKAQPRPTNLSVAASLPHNRRSRSSVYSDEDSSRHRVSRTSSLHSERSPKTSHRSSRSSMGSEKTVEDTTVTHGAPHPSARETAAAQREVTRVRQPVILAASANPQSRGVDLILSNGLGTIHSSRLYVSSTSADEVRYSYVEPEGQLEYDISQLVEEEWKPADGGSGVGLLSSIAHVFSSSSTTEGEDIRKVDVLEVALRIGSEVGSGEGEGVSSGIDEKIERIVEKVRSGTARPPAKSVSPSPPSSHDPVVGRGSSSSYSSMVNSRDEPSQTAPSTAATHTRQTSPTPSQLTSDLPYRHSEDSQRSPISQSFTSGLTNSIDSSAFSDNTLSTSQQTLPSTTVPSTGTTPTHSQTLRSASSASTHRDAPSSDASITPSSSNPIMTSTARTTPAPADYSPTLSHSNNYSGPTSTLRPRLIITRDDFGVKNMLAVISARSRDPHSSSRALAFSASSGLSKARGPDEVEKRLFGERVVDPTPAWEGKRAFVEIQKQLDSMDRELDSLLDRVLAKGVSANGSS